MTRTGPTSRQWECLVAYHRHHGNAKAAASSIGGRGISYWVFRFHLRQLCDSLGFDDLSDASLFYAEDLRKTLGRPKSRGVPRRAPDQQPCLDLSCVS